MKRTLIATTMLVWAGACHAQTTGSGTIDGLPYVTLTSPGGCSAANPCTIVEYLHPLGEQDKAPAEIQRYFNTSGFWAANPHTIVVAPMIPGSSSTNNWGDVSPGINSNMTAAVDLVQQIKSTVPTNETTTLIGGSMGAIGGELLMSLYGPKGSQQAGVYNAGLFYDGAPYQISASAMQSTLCGIPLTIVHGANDTTVSPTPDQNMAQTLSGCPGFSFISVPGMGHGTYSGASIGLDNPQLSSQMIADAQKGAPTTASSGVANPSAISPQTATAAGVAPASADTPPSIETATIKPGGGSITDSNGHVWTITASGSIMEDGQYTPGGGGTSALTIGGDGTVYGQDSGHGPVNPGGWFTLSGNGQSWQVSAAPDATTATATPAASTTAAVAPAVGVCGSGVPSGAFKTVGARIISPDGKDWIGRGINLYDSQLGQGSAIVAMFPGINFFRVSVGHDGYHDPSYYQSFISQMTAQGRVVELEHHPNGGGGQDPAYTGSALAAENAWYSSVAKAFANNPYVWFGTFNEPGTQGGSVSAWELETYNAIRNAGNNSLILLEIVGWPGAWNNSMNPADFSGMHNTVWDAHFYGWIPRYSTDQATVDQALADEIAQVQQIPSADGTMPVMIAEYGNSTAGDAIDPNGEQSVSAVVNAGGSGKVGSAAWAWLPGGNSDHLQDGGKLTSPYGEQVGLYINTDVIPCTAAQTATNAATKLAEITAQVTGAPSPSDATPAAADAPAGPAPVADDAANQGMIATADAAIAQANAVIAAAQAQLQTIPVTP